MSTQKIKYRWIILITATLSQALTYGIVYSVGVLYSDWTRYFNSPASFLSSIAGAPVAVSGVFGKFALCSQYFNSIGIDYFN